MSRDLTSGMADGVVAQLVRVSGAIEAEFDTGTVRLWTGAGDLSWNSETWKGAGNMIDVAAVEESTAVEARGVTLTLSGVPSEYLGLALTDDYRGRPVRIWLLLLNEAFDTVEESYMRFAGRMDTLTFEDNDKTVTLAMQCENNLVDLQRPRIVRYTDAEQQRLYPGDLGLRYVAALAEKPLYWGIEGAPANTGWFGNTDAGRVRPPS